MELDQSAFDVRGLAAIIGWQELFTISVEDAGRRISTRRY
jgi:hypothetical protein